MIHSVYSRILILKKKENEKYGSNSKPSRIITIWWSRYSRCIFILHGCPYVRRLFASKFFIPKYYSPSKDLARHTVLPPIWRVMGQRRCKKVTFANSKGSSNRPYIVNSSIFTTMSLANVSRVELLHKDNSDAGKYRRKYYRTRRSLKKKVVC